MSTNRYIPVDHRVNSCLIGANSYEILSTEEMFLQSPLEEFTDPIRQTPQRRYVIACCAKGDGELWIVPFSLGQHRLPHLLDAMELVLDDCLGRPFFHFPLDVVTGQDLTGYVMKPIDRTRHRPIRAFLPSSQSPRWQICMSLFRRVRELRQMGLTSNGFSREQLRVDPTQAEVSVWLNETMTALEGPHSSQMAVRHRGFFTIPDATEARCQELGAWVDGGMRDLYSAAVIAFYLIMYTHPFVGSAYYGLVREDYLDHYQGAPEYIMGPDAVNGLGNQMLSRLVADQWQRTVPQLRDLFDALFTAITHPDRGWDPSAPCWDPDAWLLALEQDATANDNESSRVQFQFENEIYHQV